MDEFTLREELSRGEESQRQFKRQIDKDHLAEDIVGFLNTRKPLLLSGRGSYADSSPVPDTSLADFDLEKLRKFYAHRYPGEELSYEEEELTRQVQVNPSFNAPASPEIPEMVFEELLVNALVHRDYFIADSVKLFIFDDRLEIISPGCLPNSLTEEEALRGIGRDRNPLLLSLAYDLMRYRGSRSGLKRVRAAIPNVSLINDIEAEEVVVAVPLP